MTGTESTTAPPEAEQGRADRLSTEALFGTRAELEIEHKGEIYRLRITRAGKLILTK